MVLAIVVATIYQREFVKINKESFGNLSREGASINPKPNMKTIKNTICLLNILSAVLLLNSGVIMRAAETPAAMSDAEIRDVITRVAKHQMHVLADGDYVAAKSVAEAKSA